MSTHAFLDAVVHDESPHRPAASPATYPGKRTLTQSIGPSMGSLAERVASVLHRRADGAGAVDGEHGEAAVATAASSTGAPLRSDLRERFEGSLGADLSAVRVHTGEESAAAAKSVGAKAYATGNDIHFAQGMYQPDDPFGLHLLAHEVAHTVQQSGGGFATRQNKLEVSSPGDAAEVEADRAADAMVSGRQAQIGAAPASVARTTVFRKEAGGDGAAGGPAPGAASPGASAGIGAKLAMTPIEWSFPLPKAQLECGLKIEPKVVFKGEYAAKFAQEGSTNVQGGAGGLKFKGGHLDQVSVFKGEVEHKLGGAGAKFKGSVDATPNGINPAIEFIGPLGGNFFFKLEAAPWKAKPGETKFLPVTVKGHKEGQYDTDNYVFKGTVGLECELSVDPAKVLKHVVMKAAPVIEAEALALCAVEGALIGTAVAGAVLVGLDYIDEERRGKLRTEAVGRAKQIIEGENLFMSVLAGKRATAGKSAVEQRAFAEATRIREAHAAKVQIEAGTLAWISEAMPSQPWSALSWRIKMLTELEKAMHAGLDAWAKAHPVKSLWGSRVTDDKKNVTRWINEMGEDPQAHTAAAL
ncbi:MAG TPA: DUF4157 domain-containing protein [Kofleriaceae bacterium]|nr:DUF4157 domain-containing protein [Kofleriaceae bacterium]